MRDVIWVMKLRYLEFTYRIRQIIEEGNGNYLLSDFKRLLSLSLRLVVEVEVVLHLMRNSGFLDRELYERLCEPCGLKRRMIVKLKDIIC